ncbi:hypothetical protein [Clostridium polynesiense]|uniref:hypothetical protein n=1 Tax=Clostridium polynesiense TaxID=1325933 RepID=UPI00058CB753|nr:hypothetical protein [Clostridium polynesiense]
MGLKMPFPKWTLVTPVKIYQTYINEDGEPVSQLLFSGKVNYSEKSKQVMNADKQLITLTGKIICEGDIAPQYPKIEGYVEVNGVKINIYRAARPRNPDGSIFSTELELS